jgi:hypothetical protein
VTPPAAQSTRTSSSTTSAAAAGLARGIRSRQNVHRAWRFSEPFASASRFLAKGSRWQTQKYKYQTGCARARCASRRVGRRAGLLRGLEESPGSLALDQGRGRAKEPLGAWKLTCSKAELGGRGTVCGHVSSSSANWRRRRCYWDHHFRVFNRAPPVVVLAAGFLECLHCSADCKGPRACGSRARIISIISIIMIARRQARPCGE